MIRDLSSGEIGFDEDTGSSKEVEEDVDAKEVVRKKKKGKKGKKTSRKVIE